MELHQIESWALRALSVVERSGNAEDLRVEVKGAWPDPRRAARRIAAHANAAYPEPVLWLVGVDERKGVVALPHHETAAWWDQVRSAFDETAPDLVDLVVTRGDGQFVALLFRTNRAPFVVTNPKGGTPDREVPWREATKVRSARRSDLVRLLSAQAPTPNVDVLSGRLHLALDDPTPTFKLSVHAYVQVAPESVVTIADHLSAADVRDGASLHIDLHDVSTLPWDYRAKRFKEAGPDQPEPVDTVVRGRGQAIVHGPGGVDVIAHGPLPLTGGEPPDSAYSRFLAVYGQQELEAVCTFGVVGLDSGPIVALTLVPEGSVGDTQREFQWFVAGT